MFSAYTIISILIYVVIGIYFEGTDNGKRKDVCRYDAPPTCKRIIFLWPLIRHAPRNFGRALPSNRHRSRLF